MGTIYYAVCEDCKQFVDLDKFDKTDLPNLKNAFDSYESYKKEYRHMLLCSFMFEHLNHRCRLLTEHQESGDVYENENLMEFEDIGLCLQVFDVWKEK